MSSMRAYLMILLIGLLASLAVIATTNFIVDPGNVYLKKIFNRAVVDHYTETMLTSRYGVVQEGWNERDVKLSLARRDQAGNCLILGSSRVMSVSVFQGDGLNRYCPRLVNLGVSGATLEDIAIFSETLLQGTRDPAGAKVFVGVSPWLFNFEMDTRYIPYQEIYKAFLRRLRTRVDSVESSRKEYLPTWFSNLISSDYFKASLGLIRRDGIAQHAKNTMATLSAINGAGSYVAQYLVEEFNFSIGGATAVTLSDGSHVYSRKIMGEVKQIEPGDYKMLPARENDDRAIALFESSLNALQHHGFQVILLLTPYHPIVWESPDAAYLRGLLSQNLEISRDLAKRLEHNLVGAYDPRQAGCNGNEFLDYMHPLPGCVNRLFVGLEQDTQ